ncbi:MAG TPA: patatin-like phospholipase family protein [Ferruginibacter sp.]|nr:patatin-like phospholipase family protein [Ferruginibacter sp.]
MASSPNNLGLALSGGGYRAAAFHVGTLKKLDELGILSKVNVLSTISGGSITGAYYCINNTSFEVFEKEMKKIISTKSVIRYILTSFIFIKAVLFFLVFIAAAIYAFFTPYPWLSVVSVCVMVTLFVLFQFNIFPVSKVIEKAYDKFLYNNATLSQLLDQKPRLAIGSTNIQTNRPFTFSKDKMEDATYSFMKPPILFKSADFPLSRAVMASSCVPFAFTPVSISREFYTNEEDIYKVIPVLVDGGVYDNQGIHKITQRHSSYECDIIITSDAGNKSPFKKSYNNVIVLLIRTMDVFMARIKNFQMMQNLYTNTEFANKQIAYLSLGWDIQNCIPGFIKNLEEGQVTASVIDSHKIPAEWVKNVKQFREQIQQLLEQNVNYKKIESEKLTVAQLNIARSVGTNLSCLSAEQVNCLSGHAANITELQVKLYCPSLISE